MKKFLNDIRFTALALLTLTIWHVCTDSIVGVLFTSFGLGWVGRSWLLRWEKANPPQAEAPPAPPPPSDREARRRAKLWAVAQRGGPEGDIARRILARR